MDYCKLELEAAFNRGCAARVKGWPLSACPHLPTDRLEYQWWRLGWREVDGHYASLVRGRWPVRPLPDVAEEEKKAPRFKSLRKAVACG